MAKPLCCEYCGIIIEKGKAFCPGCGARVKPVEEEPAPQAPPIPQAPPPIQPTPQIIVQAPPPQKKKRWGCFIIAFIVFGLPILAGIIGGIYQLVNGQG